MAEQKEKIFPQGISLVEKNIEKAPWVKAQIGINLDKFVEFANQYVDERGWLNLTLAESKAGSLYLELNQWKPEKLQKPEALKNLAPDTDESEPPF